MAYNEIIVWRQLRHPNILPFYGVFKESDRINLVSPLMRNGCLTSYLKENPQANRFRLMLDIVRGLEYLHTMKPTIVHGDMKGENILITASGRACLADFGLAASKDSQNALQTMRERHSGTLNYMAPELLLFDQACLNPDYRCSDMYAFACVCFEMFAKRPPFKGYSMVQIMDAVRNRKREGKPADEPPASLDESLWQFIQTCWSQEPEDRLTASDARQYIELVIKGDFLNLESGTSMQAMDVCEDEEWDEVFMQGAVSAFNPLKLAFPA
ncbi:kinase-like protein [Coniophora puteana RWD-64-598 SS2]|uniref:Kinase-like protein n=1 Tax=Coniophora puteana (strain RWD-64-598) TaxID=741705 RepID=A0A5M3MXV0_CONPW|nr:kinase-like protein [Coniophora puteana RWD-64-598 SS2]EIW83555.1 kinase-like protein [Coniophora puteana RWD-64-598 SS2]